MPGQDEVGPADGEALEHRDRDHALRLLGERAHGRIGRRLVARDDQQADRLRVLLLVVRSTRPRRRRRRAPFGVAGRWNAAQPGFAVEAEPVAELGQPGAAAAAAAGPDQDGAVRGGDALLELLAELRLRDAGRPRRRCGAPGWIQRSTIGARSATCSSPTTTTISAAPIVESGARNASSAVRDRLGQHGRVRAEALAQQLAERVRLLDRLGAGERGHDPALRAAQQRLGAVERVVPGELAEAAAPHALERVDDPVAGVEVRVGEAALVAEPALVDLGVVAREDPLDLALARRRRDVAADGAEAADGGDVLDLPGPRLEAVLRRGERADGAELDHVAAERRRGTPRPRRSRSSTARRGSCATSWPSSATSEEKRVQR